MTSVQAIVAAVAVVICMFIFAWTDREQPEDPEDTEESRARRYKAEGDDDNGN